ncbi:MAG TPA: GNAT family N-acetyltransferase [Candidatus Bathyarchaeia archaeon]|nr:GNAT family N-acetyltransferase [Candidatus Bathyarchaeia archaeon]
MKVALEHLPSPAELDAFIGSYSAATFFHTPAWIEALRGSFSGFEPAWITAREGESLAGLMPVVRIRKGPFHYLWALPFGTYGDPLARDETVRGALLDRFFDMTRSPACLEGGVALFRGDVPSLVPRGAKIRMEECRLVPLETGFDSVWRAWSSKRRQLARRGEEAGLIVRLLEGEDDVKRFHRIYLEESRSWGGVHPYPERLFLELFARRERGALFWGAFLGGELLGAHIDLYFGEMAQAWQGGSTERAGRFEAGALLLKSAMEEACRRGCKVFNLGSSGGNRGIVFFKESLGGREHRYPVVTVGKGLMRFLRGRGAA